uniref:Uncharacterized protein n=1 Tax=Tanacetum cinerariifolium TaxID=118510 RepID=A0A699HUB3_TANCI|nr:hypothetical protein [Tanacetum cinerariifolium]
MTSFDYRLNPLYPIKECSSCGDLYTTDYCCSEGSLRDKIICDLNKTPDLFQQPPQNCHKCGNPVDGQYCQGYTFEPSNDNTNIVNALQELFVVKQDPDENSSQSPPHINHHCSYGCGDPLEDIFFHQCTCESCGKGAHYGYNCPSKVPIIPNPEPCNNQTIDELPQTLPSFDPTCYSEDINSFTYDSRSNLVHDSPNVFNPPLQPPPYSYEFCGNNAYYGHDCPLQVPFTYDPEPSWEIILEIELAFEDQHCQPEDILELFQRLHNDVQNIHEELAVYINNPSWDRPTVCYNDDDDEDCIIAITPVLSTKEPDNSLSMGDEHLDTILETELDEFIKSSVENLVSITSESEGIPDNMCDMPFYENSPPFDVSKDQFEDFSNSNNDSTSIDDDSFSIDDIKYVEAKPPDSELVSLEVMEIVILEVGGINVDILLTIKDDILREKLLNINLLIDNIKALKDNPTSSSDFKTKSSSTSHNFLLRRLTPLIILYPNLKLSDLIWKRLVVALPLLILIFLFQIMKLSIMIMLKRIVVAVPLLILILLDTRKVSVTS